MWSEMILPSLLSESTDNSLQEFLIFKNYNSLLSDYPLPSFPHASCHLLRSSLNLSAAMFATLLVVARESSWARHQSTSSRDLLAREEACQGAPAGMVRAVKIVPVMMMMMMLMLMTMWINTRVQPLSG